jgi:hypothetical protein
MPYAIGIVLALSTVAFARLVGFDRDRAFYPIVLAAVVAIVMRGRTQVAAASKSVGISG